MSFTYPAGLWQPASAAEHAADILGQINAILQANSVKDSGGNVIQFAASLGNVVWILCLALGNIRADDDLLLLQSAQQFSIAQESDASDIHLGVNAKPIWRRYGVLEPIWLQAPTLSAADTERLAMGFLTEPQKKQLAERGDVDFAYANPKGVSVRASSGTGSAWTWSSASSRRRSAAWTISGCRRT